MNAYELKVPCYVEKKNPHTSQTVYSDNIDHNSRLLVAGSLHSAAAVTTIPAGLAKAAQRLWLKGAEPVPALQIQASVCEHKALFRCHIQYGISPHDHCSADNRRNDYSITKELIQWTPPALVQSQLSGSLVTTRRTCSGVIYYFQKRKTVCVGFFISPCLVIKSPVSTKGPLN